LEPVEITKLVTHIEENLRASPSSGLPFVDSRHSRTRLLSKQNHIVYGRRGAGKTTLIGSTKDAPDHLDIYLNLEDYKDITFPNIVIRILIEMFDALEQCIRRAHPWYKFSLKANKCQKDITSKRILLEEYLHDPDQETQEISTEESCHDELGASGGVKSISTEAKVRHDKSKHVKRSLPKSKIDHLRLELTTYKKLILSISALFADLPIFLVLDDFYFVPKAIQPDLVDYFHRLTKGTALFLKIATIKHRSKLYRRADGQYVGVEPSHDIFEVDMDYTMDNFEELQSFMRQLLDAAIKQARADMIIDDIFAGDGFSQLCLASGGVPRDFLSLFVALANKAASTGEPIGKVQVTEAAISNIGSKLDSMKKDSGTELAVLEDCLQRIKQYIYYEKRTNAFLISKEALELDGFGRQAIRELVDLRLIHLVDNNTSKAPSDGRRYEAYILDTGLYDNPRPRNFYQIEPGQRDEKARKDRLRASPVFDLAWLTSLLPSQQKRGLKVKQEPEAKQANIQQRERQLPLSFER